MRLLHEDHDFIERNGTWLLSMVGVLGGCLTGVLAYVLKSRCKRISCFGLSCDREVVALEVKDVEAPTPSKPPSPKPLAVSVERA